MKALYPVVQLSLIILKVAKVIDWSLWWVFAPTLVMATVFTAIFLSYLIPKK